MDTLNQPGQLSQESFAKKANQQPKISAKLLISVIVISLIFGSLGGAMGTVLLLRQPQGQKYLSDLTGDTLNQKISLTEDSDIINVVKQDSPAVVSIVISQDLSQVPGYGLSPFDQQNPFFNFFFNGQPAQPQQQPSSGNSNLQEVGAGSGFFVSPNGLILTNKHVVSDSTASYTVITQDGKSYDAKVVAQDPVNDLALVKISISNAPYLSLADSSNLQVGQRVIAIGNSLGQYQNTVTSGIISGIGRQITADSDTGSSEELSGVIQTDAAINPGNSGGPLLNSEGEVIGINTAIDQQGQLVGFALPANEAAQAIASYQKNGKIIKPFLGVRYITITQSMAQSQNLPETYGALIVQGETNTDVAVVPGSPADKAGLVENDIILEVNGQQLNEDNTLSNALQKYNPGDTVSLQVYHKGKIETVKATLGQQ
jgi:serine protease Do